MTPTAQYATSAPIETDGDDGFDLDVRLVEFGPTSALLLANTDDGCDTQKQGDC
ncbi:FxLD family lanthipeptide [Actinoplanes sp. RD1]|uniref:FxLD family lanthipeptide n=1 Tax=Actinoplanes sp. RD1 TaxID=3064538 RepID=UPI00274206B0|nr:FxLD family lanthipeptide [Actinoplanes sp. RD1]